MENNVIISIKGVQSMPNMEPETMELVTEGRLEQIGEASYTLSYQESELTGLEGTMTTFQIGKDRIILMRVGQFNSQMVFEEGRRHLSMYKTPYGDLSIGVSTQRMQSTLDAAGGVIEISYAIEIEHAVAGKNLFHIDVKTKDRGAAWKQ